MQLQIDLYQEIIFSESYAESKILKQIVENSVRSLSLADVMQMISYLNKVYPELNKAGLRTDFVVKKQEQILEFVERLVEANEFKISQVSGLDLAHLIFEEPIPSVAKLLLKHQPKLGWVSSLLANEKYETQLQYFFQCSPSQFIDIYKIYNLGLFDEYFKNHKNKPKIKKIVSKKIILTGEVLNVRLIYCLYFLHELGLNYDKACKIIAEDGWMNFPEKFISQGLIQQFKSLIGENYAWKLVVTLKDEYDLLDSIAMLNNLSVGNYKIPKAKNLEEFHQKLTIDSNKLRSKGLTFLQKELKALDGYILPNQLGRLALPKSSQELIDLGNKLNICVGAANYDVKIVYRGHFIIEIKDSDYKTIGCVELVSQSGILTILQAKGFKNKPLSVELIDEINRLLTESNLFNKQE